MQVPFLFWTSDLHSTVYIRLPCIANSIVLWSDLKVAWKNPWHMTKETSLWLLVHSWAMYKLTSISNQICQSVRVNWGIWYTSGGITGGIVQVFHAHNYGTVNSAYMTISPAASCERSWQLQMCSRLEFGQTSLLLRILSSNSLSGAPRCMFGWV